jgi:hypothetical protein
MGPSAQLSAMAETIAKKALQLWEAGVNVQEQVKKVRREQN